MIFDTRLWEKASCSKRDRKKILPVIKTLIRLSEKARREGLLAIEDDLPQIEPRFVRDGIRLVVDGYDPDVVKDVLLTRIYADGYSGRKLLERMTAAEGILCFQQGYAPFILRVRLYAFLGEDYGAGDEENAQSAPASFPEPCIDLSLFERAPADEACMGKLRSILLESRRIPVTTGVSADEIKALAGAVNSSAEGVRTIADLLRSLPDDVSGSVMEGFLEYDPELYGRIMKEWFTFEDLALCDTMSLHKIIREVDNVDIAMALRGANNEIREKVLAAMTSRPAQTVREALGYSGPVPVADIRQAQEKIVLIVKALEETGDIVVPRSAEFRV